MKLSLNPQNHLSLFEFVSLMAMLMSLAALSIDAMLPALPIMGQELGVKDPNHNQYIITALFIGMSLGMVVYGPLSDTFGRKPMIFLGIIGFVLGSIFSILARDFNMMLMGRFLQGLGAASTRIVCMAMIRDKYAGNTMAKVMSLITMVFIIVPTLAPSIGAVMLNFFHWRSIFALFIILSVINLAWLVLRQPETLLHENRKPFEFNHFKKATIRVFSHPQAIGYTICNGLIFGAFLGYLLSSQQIFQDVFGLKKEFPYFFGGLALTVGFASFINSRLVEKLGMQRLTKLATVCIIVCSVIFANYVYQFKTPSIYAFMTFMIPTFMSIGILFGNLNSLALEPLGDIAGMASSIISSVNNLFSISLGAFIGSQFQGNLVPFITGFLILSTLTLMVIYWIERSMAKIQKQS